jgi:hypothetical protein
MNLIFKLIGSIILSFETCWKTKTFIKALTVIGYLFPCSPQQVALVRSWSTKIQLQHHFPPRHTVFKTRMLGQSCLLWGAVLPMTMPNPMREVNGAEENHNVANSTIGTCQLQWLAIGL